MNCLNPSKQRGNWYSRTTAVLLVLLVWFNPVESQALAQKQAYASHQVIDGQLVITRTDDVTVTLNTLNNDSIEIVYQQPSEHTLPGMALAPDVQLSAKQHNPSISTNEDELRVDSGTLSVLIDKQTLTLEFVRHGKTILTEATSGYFFNTVRGLNFTIDEDEKFYGGGQRVMGMDRRGQRMPLYNKASYGYTTEANQMYYGLPAVISSRLYAVLFDNTASGNLDIGHTQSNVLNFDAVGGRLAYIVTAADNMPALVRQITSLTGKQPLPPRWALGNFASRFGYHSQAETLDVINKFNQYDIPVDGVVLDLYWFGPDIKGHMGNLDWNRDAFPDPEAMISQLKSDKVNTVLITEPFILSTSKQFESASSANALAKNSAGAPRRFDFYFGNTGIVDVFSQQGRNWFGQFYKNLAEQGVAGWWGDLGEPEVHPYDAIHNWDGVNVTADEIHNAYGHRWAQMVYEGSQTWLAEQRPLVLMRSGYLGSQRFGMIPWTGDVSRSWGGFQPQVELALQMSVFGLAYNHADLGGFAGGETFDAELYVRWLQAGVFTPVYRPHAQEHIAPEPVFHPQPIREFARQAIQLRYDMLPYNYSLAYENSLTGMPLMRPLSFVDVDKYFEHKDSYMWGPALLVHPIVNAEVESLNVSFPEGIWYDFFSADRYEGNQSYNIPTEPSHIPVFAKAGSFVPMYENLKRTHDAQLMPLVMHYWHHASAQTESYQLYEDDGISPHNIADQAYLKLVFDAQHNQDSLKMTVRPEGHYPGMPQEKSITWVIHGVDSSPVAVSGLDSSQWQFNAQTNTLTINSTLNLTSASQVVIQFEL